MQAQCHCCGVKFAHRKNLARHLQNAHNFVFEEAMKPEKGNPRIKNLDANVLVKEVSNLMTRSHSRIKHSK